MLITEHTIETKASPAQIWKVWQDVENWKRWDRDIEFSRIDGPFQTGTAGSTKFLKTPAFKTLLTEVKPMELVVQEAYLSSAKVISRQSMSQTADKATRVTFRVEIQGPLSFFYACLLRRFIREKIPLEMNEMNKMALTIQER